MVKEKRKPGRPKKKSNAGRPTKMSLETVQKLEEAFLMGCPDKEACLFAGISKTTLYNYQDANPEYVDRKEMLKSNPVMKSRKVILDSVECGDVSSAKYLVDKADGKAKETVESTGKDGSPIEHKWLVEVCTPGDVPNKDEPDSGVSQADKK